MDPDEENETLMREYKQKKKRKNGACERESVRCVLMMVR